jgi:hypothetical protein
MVSMRIWLSMFFIHRDNQQKLRPLKKITFLCLPNYPTIVCPCLNFKWCYFYFGNVIGVLYFFAVLYFFSPYIYVLYLWLNVIIYLLIKKKEFVISIFNIHFRLKIMRNISFLLYIIIHNKCFFTLIHNKWLFWYIIDYIIQVIVNMLLFGKKHNPTFKI